MDTKKATQRAASLITKHDKYNNISSNAYAQLGILSALSSGRQMSVVDLTNELHIPDPRSAIRELRNAGVPISDYWIKSPYSRYKVYFIHNFE